MAIPRDVISVEPLTPEQIERMRDNAPNFRALHMQQWSAPPAILRPLYETFDRETADLIRSRAEREARETRFSIDDAVRNQWVRHVFRDADGLKELAALENAARNFDSPVWVAAREFARMLDGTNDFTAAPYTWKGVKLPLE